MSRRTLVYLGIAVALLVGGRLLTSSPAPVPTPVEPVQSPYGAIPTSTTLPSASAPLPIRRPPTAIAEFGVLTDRSEDQLESRIDDASLAMLVTPDLCGDVAACDAVHATLKDESATHVQVLDASTWSLEKADLDAGGAGLTAAERANLRKLQRVVVVHVAAPAGPEQLALRAALAATAAIARDFHGIVWDQLLARFESARTFASHAVTTPLGASVFRRDRVDVLYQPAGEGVIRVLTAGLSRWGQPDVEAAAVAMSAAPRMAEVVLAVAKAIADGATTQPLILSRDDVATARGQPYPSDAGFPESKPIEVDVVTAHPHDGDPNDFIARIVPPVGEGPIGMMDLAERFFGPLLSASPGNDVLTFQRATAQGKLGTAVSTWQAQRASGARLLVLLPFAIPGDAGIESMWIDVTRADARTVTGKVMDEPLGATDVKRGDEVTRPRTEVEDLDLRGVKPDRPPGGRGL